MPPTFELPQPHVLALNVDEKDIDAYRHVNNAVYVGWCDLVAWDHSTALGLPLSHCLEIDRGMAVVRSVFRYLRPALQGDQLLIATWILPSDSPLCVRRRFQLVRANDGATLLRAEIEYACIRLSTGRPVRWPPEFRERYVTTPAIATAVETLDAV